MGLSGANHMSHAIASAGSAPRRASRGFTLVELLITIALVAILTAIALPSFGTVIRNNRITTQTNDLISAFTLARNEAVTRSRGVSVCAADTRNGVPAECGDSSDWEHGWVVFIDDTVAASGPTTIAAASVLRMWEGDSQNQLLPESSQFFVRFTPRGEISSSADVKLTMKPKTDCSAQQRSVVSISAMGRPSALRMNCTD